MVVSEGEFGIGILVASVVSAARSRQLESRRLTVSERVFLAVASLIYASMYHKIHIL
jgi:hypothetical protein